MKLRRPSRTTSQRLTPIPPNIISSNKYSSNCLDLIRRFSPQIKSLSLISLSCAARLKGDLRSTFRTLTNRSLNLTLRQSSSLSRKSLNCMPTWSKWIWRSSWIFWLRKKTEGRNYKNKSQSCWRYMSRNLAGFRLNTLFKNKNWRIWKYRKSKFRESTESTKIGVKSRDYQVEASPRSWTSQN